MAYQEYPATRAAVITKSDVTLYRDPTKAIYVGGTGHLNVVMADDTAATLFSAIPAGSILPIRVKQVLDTGTTATLIVGLWGG